MTEFSIDVGSARLSGTDHRPPGPSAGTLVALHAGVTDRRAWELCTPTWTRAGWRVITYDRRGFGSSEWEPARHDAVADLLAVLDGRRVGEAVLLGNSMGGALAIDTALAHPARVGALVLVASAVGGRPDPSPEQTTGPELEQDEQIAAAEEAGDTDLVNRLECRYWLDGTEAPEGRVPDPVRSLFLAMNGRALAAPPVGEVVDRPAAWERLGDIGAPALVVTGALDLRSVGAAARRLADDIPASRLVELEASAHLPSLDDPRTFAEVVLDFLDGLP